MKMLTGVLFESLDIAQWADDHTSAAGASQLFPAAKLEDIRRCVQYLSHAACTRSTQISLCVISAVVAPCLAHAANVAHAGGMTPPTLPCTMLGRGSLQP